MSLFRHHVKTAAKVPSFVQCAGCSYDFITGEGARACGWYECPYLPEQYKVFCPDCNYNFATGEGAPRCSDPPICDRAIEGRAHALMAREHFHV
jgi:hypothetical protein